MNSDDATMDGRKTCPLDGNTTLIMVEYGYPSPEQYDGISEYMWQPCGHRFGRWTGKLIPKGFCEPRYGRGGAPIKSEDNK